MFAATSSAARFRASGKLTPAQRETAAAEYRKGFTINPCN